MAHAHPLSDGPYLPSPLHQSSHVSPTTPIPAPRSPASPLQLPDSASQHYRRLQLRNAGFRGPLVPARNISPFVFANSTNDENSPRSIERRTSYGGDLTPSPTSILQAINNTTSRTRYSPRAGLFTIFQDSTATKPSDKSQINSWRNEASNKPSPVPRTGTPLRTMKLREGSLNEKTVPTSSIPPIKYERSKRTARSKPRVSSGEASKYIEHLEAELASLNAKLDALMSPAKVKAQSSKFRALHTQVRRQSEELAEWEEKFEERVSDEIYERTQNEQGLKARIKELEDSCQGKEAKIEALENELESTKVKAKDVESLESTNYSLERRLDVLTELIAQSPTRGDFPTSFPIPSTIDPTKQTSRPRPRSLLLPKIQSLQSSPAAPRFSNNYSADLALWHSRNIASISSLSISESPEDGLQSPFDDGRFFIDTSDLSMRSTSLELGGHGALPSLSATRASSRSRPTSMLSNFSFGTSLGLGVPLGYQEEPKSTAKSRKMRRFPSGSCALKPLILPVATAVTPSLPVSAPACSNHTTPFTDLSSNSIDPTIAFLSKDAESSLFMTPTQASRRRSATLGQKQNEDSFHELIVSTLHEDEIHPEKDKSLHADDEMLYQDKMPYTPSPVTEKPKRRSLQMELEAADRAALAGSDGSSPANSTPESSEVIMKGHKPQVDAEFSTLSDVPQPQNECEHSSRPRGSSNTSTYPATYPKTTLSSFASRLPEPTPTPAPQSSPSLLHRLKRIVTSLHQDPVSLARNILVKAWTASSSYAGGLGWWLLGLVSRFRHRKNHQSADRNLVEEESQSTKPNEIDWHEYSADASKLRRRRALLKNAEQDGDLIVERTLNNQQGTDQALICDDCVEPRAQRSLRLWLRFSLALVLAVGVAVKDGPETLLVDIPPRRRYTSEPDIAASGETDPASRKTSGAVSMPTSIQSSGNTLVAPSSLDIGTKDTGPKNLNQGYWGWEVTFAENLGPADFEKKKKL